MESDKPQEFMCGGFGESQPAGPEVQAICDSVKSHVEEQRGEKYEIFEAKTYKKQTVAGYKYFVKVHVGENKHLDLVVFVGLPHTNSGPVLQSVHESTADQISDLEQEGVRLIDPQPVICTYGFRQPEMRAPDYPVEMVCGGIGESQPADPEVQAICDSVKSEVEEQRGEKYEIFKAISYKKQTVYGYNYFVKVHVGENKHLELFLYVEPSPNSGPVLRRVQDFTDDQMSDLQQTIREPVLPRELFVGGIGESQPADPEVQAICDSVKSDVEEQRGEKYEIFEAISYKKQTVAGLNYFVKVHVGENKHLELVVFVGLPHTNSGPVLQSVHESTADQISDLGQEGGRFIDPKPFICYYPCRQPPLEMRAPDYPVEMVCGGIEESQPANPEVQAICDSVKSDVEEQRGEKYEIFKAISYKKQTVAGLNYFVKVHVGENKHLDLVVFVGLPHTNSGPVLQSVHESTADQISDLEQEGMRLIDPQPVICTYGFRQPEMRAPDYPVEMVCGGIGESQPADPEVQAICDSVKSEVEEQRGEKYEIFKAISYKKQTVYGYNYFVKVHVGENKHLELFLYVEPSPNSGPVLRRVQDFTDDQMSDLQQTIREPVLPRELFVGGIGESQPADPEVQAICDSVKSDVEEQRGEKYEIFEAISYKKQTVAGLNYFVKVHVGENKHLELVVFVGLPHTNSGPVLQSVHESTADQISDLGQEGGRFIDPKPFICYYPCRQPPLEMRAPDYPVEMVCGGIEESQPANPEVQAICDSVKSDVEEQRGEKYEIFKAISYKKQTVAGLNYFVKVHVGENKHLDLVVFVGLPHTNSGPVLQSVHESTADQISDLEQEGVRLIDPQPVICTYGFRQPEMRAPDYPVEMVCGGIGESQPADPEVQAICDSVKSEVEEQRGEKYEIFKAISYKKQTVYGYNYFVKVHVGENKHLELFLYVEPSPNSGPVLRRVQDFTDDQMSDLQQTIREPVLPREFLVGGIGESQPADPEVQAICDSVKSDVEEQRGEKYEIFEAISYKKQTVAGLNYFVKVHVGENKHLELVVFVGLPHTNSGPVLRRVHELKK